MKFGFRTPSLKRSILEQQAELSVLLSVPSFLVMKNVAWLYSPILRNLSITECIEERPMG